NETEITSMNAGCSIQVNYCKPIESIVIDGPSTVSIGTDVTYNKTITPTDADKQKLTWSVENGTGSASISSDAVLHPISAGTVTVKAVSKDARAVVGTFEVIIENVVVPTPNPTPDVVSNPEPIQTKHPPKTADIVGDLSGGIVLMFVACGVSVLCLKKDNKKSRV
ncbi:MAG: Ig-like domain-containing protein, partial [Coprobacillus sp.]